MTIDWRNYRDGLDPGFAQDVEACLGPLPDHYVVTFGRRTREVQAALFASYRADLAAWFEYKMGSGPKPDRPPRRAAPPGKSAHEYGLAIDLTVDGSPEPGVQPDWNIAHPAWLRLFDAVFQHPRLHSGRSFQDADHVEAVNWKSRAGLVGT